MSREAIMILFCVVGLVGLIMAGHERTEEEIQRQHYCEMVQIHKDSGSQYGWPAYDGECE